MPVLASHGMIDHAPEGIIFTRFDTEFLQVLTGFCDLVRLRTILRLPLGRVPKYMRRYKIDTDTKSRAILVYRKVLFRREDDSLNKHQFVQPSYNKP